jgi:hypothetical protein
MEPVLDTISRVYGTWPRRTRVLASLPTIPPTVKMPQLTTTLMAGKGGGGEAGVGGSALGVAIQSLDCR